MNTLTKDNPNKESAETTQKDIKKQEDEKSYNALEGVLYRHEQISNRVKSRKV